MQKFDLTENELDALLRDLDNQPPAVKVLANAVEMLRYRLREIESTADSAMRRATDATRRLDRIRVADF